MSGVELGDTPDERPMMAEVPPYIEPSEDLSEDERDLAQALSNRMHEDDLISDGRGGLLHRVNPIDLAKVVIEEGWVPESALHHAEYERDHALTEVRQLREALLDLKAEIEAEPELEEPEDYGDVETIEERSMNGNIVYSFTQPSPQRIDAEDAIRRLVEQERVRRMRYRMYIDNFQWKDL
jgi:hypothetical protein